MRNNLLVLIALFGLFVSGASEAAVARCEGCSSAEFKARAIRLGLGTHTITSLSTNKIKRFYVVDRTGGEPNAPRRLWATDMGVPSDLNEIFAAGVGFYQATNGTMRAVVQVRADQLGVAGASNATVYQGMSDFNLRSRMGDRLARGPLPGVGNQLDMAGEKLIQGLFGHIGISDGSIEVVVEMKGGGIMVFKLSAGIGTGVYQQGRSRTPAGQWIPEANTPAGAGVWYGGGNQGYNDDLGEFINYMQQLGVTVTGSGGGISSCTWVGSGNGGTLSCRLKSK